MSLLSDDDFVALRKTQVGRYGQCDVTKPYSDSIAYGRAVESEVLRRVREGVVPATDESDLLTIAYMHGFSEGKKATPPDAQARIAELEAALRECVDLAWIDDSHSVQFDGTVLFGLGYDFSGVDGPAREEFLAEYECIVWPSGGTGRSKWSAYCTYDGSLWFEKFDTSTEAKEACMQLLDKVLPQHPAMKARAALQPKEPTK
jgi:hypothetical protein